MTQMTFGTLQEQVRDYLERGHSGDAKVYERLPDLINTAERNIAKKLNVLGVRQVAVAAMTSGLAVYGKPQGWRRTVSINYGAAEGFTNRTPLFARSYEYCRSYWPNDVLTSSPEFYADYNEENWLIAPTPDAAYPFEVIYFSEPVLLSSANQTNWLTDTFPNLLLYQTLSEVAAFLKDEAEMAKWDAKFRDMLGATSEDDLKRVVDRNTTRQES